MNYIRGYCKTNLDNFDCSIVNVFCSVPKIGDRVRVLYKKNVTTLKVCKITHDQQNGEPFIVVELTN